jgi:hypothetical protein
VIDGGRTNRTRERFAVRLDSREIAHGIVRLEGDADSRVELLANGERVGEFVLGDDDGWVERTFDVPANVAGSQTTIELRVTGPPLTVFHYWFGRGAGGGG